MAADMHIPIPPHVRKPTRSVQLPQDKNAEPEETQSPDLPPSLQSPHSPHSPLTPSTLKPDNGSYIELKEVRTATDDARSYVYSASSNTAALPAPPAHKPSLASADDSRRSRRRASSSSRQHFRDIAADLWLFEFFAWMLSAVALGVIVGTIAVVDGKPLPQWPMSVTLNAFVSFMAAVMKAAVLIPVAEGISQLKWLWFERAGSAGVLHDIQTFDEASRGLWGSVKLMLGTRGVHLAKLGAFLTVVNAAAEPLIQQSVTYPSRLVPWTPVSKLPTEQNAWINIAYDYGDYDPGTTSMTANSPTLAMKAAIYSGLYDTNPSVTYDFKASYFCPTGNCTWPSTYSSLAVCSKCANVTSSLTKSCTDGEVGGRYCDYSLPNGFTLTGAHGAKVYMNSTGYLETINFNDTGPTIASINTIRSIHDQSSTKVLGAEANECVLYFCVNEYRALSESYNFTEKAVSTYTSATRPSSSSADIALTPPNSSATYTVTHAAWQALRRYFADIFHGNVTGALGRAHSDNEALQALYQMADDGSGTGAAIPGREARTIGILAKSMTQVLRSSCSAYYQPSAMNADDCRRNVTKAFGTISVVETYVHARWPWLVLPIALELLTLAFLAATVAQSRGRGVAVWKSSTLPLLQVRLVDEGDEGGRGTVVRDNAKSWGSGGRLHDLNKWAMSSEVRLFRGEAGQSELYIHRRKKADDFN